MQFKNLPLIFLRHCKSLPSLLRVSFQYSEYAFSIECHTKHKTVYHITVNALSISLVLFCEATTLK